MTARHQPMPATACERRTIDAMFFGHVIMSAENIPRFDQVEHEADLLIDRIMSGSRNIDAMPAIARHLPLAIVTDLVGPTTLH